MTYKVIKFFYLKIFKKIILRYTLSLINKTIGKSHDDRRLGN